VLRRIIRRAIATATSSGARSLSSTASSRTCHAGWARPYPELPRAKERVTQVLKAEEERFAETLENGMKVLEGALHREDRMLDGETVFQLYDTFGFPVDLTADMARERGIMIDHAGFEAGDAAPARARPSRGQVQDGRGRRVFRARDGIPRLRHPCARRREGGCALPGRDFGAGDRGGGSRHRRAG